ncbi:M61 family metallopeptidase [Arenibacter amylolyticus]|uniref:M61 family metallopeptidase n=1 Tax=Arenibacter amylolyticus TaxID=1406873 RepID=UPI000A3D4916|nr:peptidase M61 [Arenibacter amylolyticus]
MCKKFNGIKRSIVVGLVALAIYSCSSSKLSQSSKPFPIIASMDLVNVVGDKVKVTVDPGPFPSGGVTFYIPAIVPGTYSVDNYGKYIEQFQALDYKGKALAVDRLDDNAWYIANAKDLDKVAYWVNDTYDTEGEVEEKVFSPAGTNILEGENFMLNLHGFVGYFTDLKEVPYTLRIKAPKGLEPVTTLDKGTIDEQDTGVDVFKADRYFEIIDNPILYSKPNTETFIVNDIEVTLSVYSPNGLYTATDLKGSMEKMMAGQKKFLGDINSTKQYAILLYLSTMEETDASGYGALEHHTSTVVVLPEGMPKDRLEEALIDIVSHEFFHILTPLSVHSEEIHYFDFNEPKMSQHLWLYEGTTEYFANLFQIHQGIIAEEEFYGRLMDKVANSRSYDDEMSLTQLSKNVLAEPYKSNFINIYEKGALVNMALDIRLRELSKGEKGVLWLLKELSKKYGEHRPFEDDKLIAEIVELTYPEIQEFFDVHVVGDTPLDYEAYWSKVGLQVISEVDPSGYFFDGEMPMIDVDPKKMNQVFVREGISLSSFYADLGLQGGDVIQSIDGTVITLESMRPIIGQSFGWTPDKEIEIVVLRDGKELLLRGKVGAPTMEVKKLVPVAGVTQEQQKLRESWLKG